MWFHCRILSGLVCGQFRKNSRGLVSVSFFFFFVSFGVWHDLNCGLTWKCLVCGRKLVIPTCSKGSFWQMMSWRNELRPDLPARPWL